MTSPDPTYLDSPHHPQAKTIAAFKARDVGFYLDLEFKLIPDPDRFLLAIYGIPRGFTDESHDYLVVTSRHKSK